MVKVKLAHPKVSGSEATLGSTYFSFTDVEVVCRFLQGLKKQ